MTKKQKKELKKIIIGTIVFFSTYIGMFVWYLVK